MASSTPDNTGKMPLPPKDRARLQQLFTHGNKSMAKGDFDYATEMFARCVEGDPGNSVYVQSFLANLQKKYNNNKKGSKFAVVKGAGARASWKKATLSKDPKATIKASLELLKLNPWDTGALKAMASVAEGMEHDDAQLAYLKAALDADVSDVEINRLAGRALARVGRFDDAIRCWVRVQKAVQNDPEANKAIGDLTVEKTISHGRYEEAESSRDVRHDREATDAPTGPQMTPERQLEKAIAKDPSDVGNYLKLAELHQSKDRLDDAEKAYQRALEVSGGDVNIAERLENLQLARMREQLSVAEKKARAADASDDDKRLYLNMSGELLRRELEAFRKRVDRNPTHTGYKYELGLRLHRAKMYKEAIPMLQQAQSDLAKQGEIKLLLGECFQAIKQYALAMSNYEGAIESISPIDTDRKKLALYRAGVLAMALKDLAKADRFLSELAGMDFGYKDVAARLDKLREIRDKS
jgi:tetratricopeptide (TPR) repeat protein